MSQFKILHQKKKSFRKLLGLPSLCFATGQMKQQHFEALKLHLEHTANLPRINRPPVMQHVK